MYFLNKGVDYIIADPSLVLSEKEYLLFKFELAGRTEMVVNGYNIIVFKSLSGSGSYYTNSAGGEKIYVKDKFIAAIPMNMCNSDKMVEFELNNSIFHINTEKHIGCKELNGLMSFSNIQVNTDANNVLGADYWGSDEGDPEYIVTVNNKNQYFQLPNENDIPF